MPDLITSTQNPRVKMVRNLQQRARLRRKERKIVLEGLRLMRDALERGYTPEYVLYQPDNTDYQLIAELQNTRAEIIPVSGDVMNHASDTSQPQGVIGVFPIPLPKLPRDPKRVLILDAIREPGNMGTILRTAGAADVWIVLLAPGCVDPYNPKVLRAGMGAHFRVPIVESSWAEIAGYCDESQIYIASGSGDMRYTEVDWTEKWALIIGNEAHGSNPPLGETPIKRIAIPMAADTESINAAVATGVILFEAQRQRTTP